MQMQTARGSNCGLHLRASRRGRPPSAANRTASLNASGNPDFSVYLRFFVSPV